MSWEALAPALRVGAAAYAGLCLLVLFRQSGYVYYPDRDVGPSPEYLGMRYEEVRLKTEDGETLGAWFVPAQPSNASPASVVGEPARIAPTVGGARRALLFCHGNAGNISHRLDSMLMFREMGLDVLIFDYRGYGDSTGRPSEKGTYADATAAWDWLTRERGYPADRIVVFGESLGGSVAAWLAARVRPAALAVESAFTSAPDMAAAMFPYLPARWLCRFRYDTLRAVRTAGCPVIVAHSLDDEMVPFAHGQRLFDAAAEPKRLIRMRGGHNSGGLASDARARETFAAFLRDSAFQ